MDKIAQSKIVRALIARPLSLLAAAFSVFIILYVIFQFLKGQLYTEALNNIDGTTLIMLGILTLRGAFALRHKTDFQAVSFILVNALSFIYAYEALFKWSFYMIPFRHYMPAPEFRDFVIQVGIALSALAGFAEGYFTLKKWTFVWFGLFVVLWISWLLVGFPQITGQVMYIPVIKINFTWLMTYVINRLTKVVLFLVYFTFFSSSKK